MRIFFGAVGVLAWIAAVAVLWIFAESGGALTIIAAGVYAVVAMVALGCERILKALEEIRDRRIGVPERVQRPAAPARVEIESKPRGAVI